MLEMLENQDEGINVHINKGINEGINEDINEDINEGINKHINKHTKLFKFIIIKHRSHNSKH